MNDVIRKGRSNRALFSLLIYLAAPIIVQNLISNSLVMIDTVMISRLGEEAVAAVGVAGRLNFILMLVIYGFYAGAGVFVAQFNGSKQYAHIRQPMSVQIAVGFLITGLFTIIASFYGENFMRIFSKDDAVIQLGIEYLRYLALSFIPSGFAFSFVMGMRSTKDPRFPMFASVVSMSLNAFLNYGLIFGRMGFPELGVAGAAIATSISKLAECAMMVYTVYLGSRKMLSVFPRDFLRIDRDFIQKYLALSWPIILNEGLWGLGTVMYSLAYSKLGTVPFAASQMAQIVNDILLVFSFGLASAVGTILGNKLGEGKRSEAIADSRIIMKLAVAIGLATGAMALLILPAVPKVFSVRGESARLIREVLVVRAIANCFVTFNWTNVTGILRSGGDTVFGLLIDVIPMWLVGVPIALAGAMLFGWSLQLVVVATVLDELVKFTIGLPRALQNKWANVLVEGS